jgi:adenine-specific DNA-methyltransferase
LRRIPPAILGRSRELRHPLTAPEKRLWDRVRDHQLGVHIRRQHVVLGRFIADFNCASARLCIEVDGDTHAQPDQVEYDAARTRLLEGAGFQVIRFSNGEVVRNLEGVLAAIQSACEVRDALPPPQPSP